MGDGKIEVLNVNAPHHVTRVDATKYEAMKRAMMKVIPVGEPGMTAKDIKAGVLPHLPDDLFPGGSTAGWWLKCVQLDLEARKAMARSSTSPLKFWKTEEGGE